MRKNIDEEHPEKSSIPDKWSMLQKVFIDFCDVIDNNTFNKRRIVV